MKFDFFTCGGAVFWEDVFFYQKWRIQRNCYTKKYRLLDSWDIRRASGTFEYCQKAFIEYINCYEIPRQKGKMVILLHGYADGKNIFKPLWRKLVRTNTVVAAINYPSLFRSSIASAHQLLFFLNHLEDINEVSFVTKGGGNLVLRQLFNLPIELQNFRQKMRIGNIVEIQPVVKDSLLCDFLCRFKIFRFFLGPMIKDFTESGLKYMPSLPNEFNVLKILTDSDVYQYLLSINKETKGKSLQTREHFLYISDAFSAPLKNEQVLNNTVKFINNGKI